MNPNDFNILVDLYKSGQIKKAESQTKKMIGSFPNEIILYNLLGAIYIEKNKLNHAAKCFKKALVLNSNYAEAYNNLGIIFQKQGKNKEAILNYTKAVSINEKFHKAHKNLGILLREKGELFDAIKHFKKSYELNNNSGEALIDYWHLKQFCCDWSNRKLMKKQIANFLNDVNYNNEKEPCKVFPMLSMFDDPGLHLKASEYYAKNIKSQNRIFNKKNILIKNKKIKIAYLSDDFRDHPSSYLAVGVLENHSRKEFEIYCISTCDNDKSEIRKRVENACDVFIDVKNKSNFEVAKLIDNLSINVLVDINGYTKGSRLEIFSHFNQIPTVGFLGYAGTVNKKINQYKIADPIVAPKNKKHYYSENIIYLPNTYHCTDDMVKVYKNNISKISCKLPQDSFVFCCFNQSYKISPEIFKIWLRLLKKTNKSVLWLLSSNKWAEKNLISYAKKEGVEEKRIIFADKLPHHQHLARIKNADLILDTFPYNAHTTASDALWSCVPFISLRGESFASRVGSSILTSIKMTELITTNLKDYEMLALKVAKSPKKLKYLKKKVRKNIKKTPLFNTALYTINLEKAYKKILKQDVK